MNIFKKLTNNLTKLNKKDKNLFFIFLSFIIFGLFFLILFSSLTKIEPKVKGKISYGTWIQPRFINPILANNETDAELINLIYDSLVELKEDGSYGLDLASNIFISDDYKTYEVTLRDDVYFHDGEKFDADDVIYTIKLIQNPYYKSPLREIWKNVVVSKKDDNLLVFQLLEPNNIFSQALSLKILSEHIWNTISYKQIALTEYNLKPVGTGPFMFDKFEKEQGGRIVSYHLKRNPNYYKTKVYITDFVMKFYNNSSTAFEALLKSKINLIKELSPSQYNMIKNKLSISVKGLKLPTYYSIIINQKNKDIYDIRLAQALEYAINKQELVNKVFYGQAEPINLPISKGFLGYIEDDNTSIYDISKSKALLSEMNFKDIDGDGYLEKNGEKFELSFIVASIDHLLLVSDYLKQSFDNIGIKVNLKRVPLVDFQNEYLLTGNFDLILSGVNYGIKPDLHFIWSSSQPLNISGFHSTKLDSYLSANLTETDQSKYEENLFEIQKLLKQYKPAIFLYNDFYLYAKSSKIKGDNLTVLNKYSDKFENIHNWYMYQTKVFK